LDNNEHCFEEQKMIEETRKILDISELPVYATTARVPLPLCHSESITAELSREVSIEELQSIFRNAEGIRFSDGGGYQNLPDPRSVAGQREVWVARLRLPFGKTRSKVVQYWNIADNLKKGAATNAVQILKYLL